MMDSIDAYIALKTPLINSGLPVAFPNTSYDEISQDNDVWLKVAILSAVPASIIGAEQTNGIMQIDIMAKPDRGDNDLLAMVNTLKDLYPVSGDYLSYNTTKVRIDSSGGGTPINDIGGWYRSVFTVNWSNWTNY